MNMAISRFAERRHPWLATFEKAPEKAFGDLLSGYADVYPYERADAPDAALMLFKALAEDDDARKALGPAIISWLKSRRIEALPAAPPKLQKRVREICEALEIVALLRVTDAAAELRRNVVIWNDWVSNMVLSPARDARAEYWRMLALTQPLIVKALPSVDQWGLNPLWQQICRESGGRFPARYLDIGLLGLRYLPDHSNGSELPWVSGLAQWALAQHPSTEEFRARWFGLKPLYPRAPQRWRKLIGELLTTKRFVDAGIKAPAWWDIDDDFKPMTQQYFSAPESLRSPSPQDCNQVIAKFSDPFTAVEPLIDRLIVGHRRYLHATGDSQFIVRAIHALGQALIEDPAGEPHRRANKAQALAREGLDWEPNNPYLWSLWRDALAVEGNFHAAEMVGWELVRRLPENPEARTELATLLADTLGRLDDAEAVLREAISDFPDDLYPRTQLAELLIAVDRKSEAAAIVDTCFDDDLQEAVAYALRARLYSNSGRADLALTTVLEGIDSAPTDSILLQFKSILENGRTLPLASHAKRRVLQLRHAQSEPAFDPSMESVVRFGEVRKLRHLMESDAPNGKTDATERLQIFLRDNPTFAYAVLLAARHHIWEAESNTLPPVAVAFEDALATEDRAKLEELAKREKRLEALILVACAVLGDADTARDIASRLENPKPSDDDRGIAVLRSGLHPIFTLIEGGRPSTEVFLEKRAVILRTLHDANEAMLGDILVAA